MKLLTVLHSQMEAQMLCNMLQAQGIDAMTTGTKKYASHITGVDQGRYEIMVPESDIEKAIQLTAEVEPEVAQTEVSLNPTQNLKRAYILAACGMILVPVLFNIGSLVCLKNYARDAEPGFSKNLWIIGGLALNAVGAYICYLIWNGWLL